MRPAIKGRHRVVTKMKTESVKHRQVTDRHLRLWHWLMAFSFMAAYLTGESERWKIVHVTLGYTLLLLLVWRLFWGVFGPKPLRLGVWKQRLKVLKDTVGSGVSGWMRWQSWQVPLIGASVVLTMMMVFPLVLSGYLVYQEWAGDWLGEVHEMLSNVMLLTVCVHLFGLVIFGLLRQRNLMQPMLLGTMNGPGPDLIKSQKTIWAIVLMSGVLIFWGWQWKAVPELRGEKTASIVTKWLHPLDVSDVHSQPH